MTFFEKYKDASLDDLPELYEAYLAETNKDSKKVLGQYYTPKDVSTFVAKEFWKLYEDGDNIADVCCGCGNLVVSLLEQRFVKAHIYLYDVDKTALKIAHTRLKQYIDEEFIHLIQCDFLAEDIELPKNTVSISNPPYGRPEKDYLFFQTSDTNNLYALLTEKIVKQSKNAVFIIPQSFTSGAKYQSLRDVLSLYGGDCYCFDNVPATIFCGRKKGIFNTNTSNSVRTSFLIVNKRQKGYRLTPLLRFKAEERDRMFDELPSFLGQKRRKDWLKVPALLENFIEGWMNNSLCVGDVIETNKSLQKEELKLVIPSTPRYYLSAVRKDLSRASKIVIYAKTRELFDTLYLCLNSSVFYLWWRMRDGELSLKEEDLLSFPIQLINNHSYVDNLIAMEEEYTTTKKNAGKINENVKFPESVRDEINAMLNAPKEISSIHKNCLF